MRSVERTGCYICRNCGGRFVPRDTSKSHLSRHPPKFCSHKRAAAASSKKVTLICRQCGRYFNRKRYMEEWSTSRGPFCSMKCYAKWQSENLIGNNRKREVVLCHICGTPIERQPSAVASHNFCSRDCFAKWRASEEWSGSNNPAWLGGHEAYRGPNWDGQSKVARKRDGNTCQRCAFTGPELPVHHIRPFRLFDDYSEANKLLNLRTLCPACHGIEEQEFWAAHS